MIQSLLIRNLILIEHAEIQFGSGLNIITGETGAGKSAILAAIRLILGERADAELVRIGADLAVVEAEIQGHLVRREVHRLGRSRAFIDDELVSLSELRDRLSSIEMIDQSAAQKLSDHQMKFLDSFGKIDGKFAEQFLRYKQAEKRFAELLEMQKSSTYEQDKIRETLALLEEINWQPNEEQQLAEEHQLLLHGQELLEKIAEFSESMANLSGLKKISHQLGRFRDLAECSEWIQTGAANLDEAHRHLLSYASKLEADPARLFAVEKRLGEIETIKKRFGPFNQVEILRNELKNKADRFTNLDQEIEQAKIYFEKTEKETFQQATALTNQRKKLSEVFSKIIVSELQELNLPDVRFSIEILEKPLSSTGADEIRFLFAANPGTPLQLLNDCASGGELSRLLFAIKIVMAEKDRNTCLIFDEIDSNVGGKTAAILGAKLKQLSSQKQLICVTHFVQVARFASDHFLVSKNSGTAEAKTLIQKLQDQDRHAEYSRMTGL